MGIWGERWVREVSWLGWRVRTANVSWTEVERPLARSVGVCTRRNRRTDLPDYLISSFSFHYQNTATGQLSLRLERNPGQGR